MEKDGFRLKLQKGAGEQTVFMPAAPIRRQCRGSAPDASVATRARTQTTAPAQGHRFADGRHVLSRRLAGIAAVCRCRQGSNEETVVCIIEAMKVMNEIKAEVRGVIAEVVAENGKPVSSARSFLGFGR